ncbi:MAG: class I SAM-dependent methyltransferase [Planctomycetota bacterium]
MKNYLLPGEFLEIGAGPGWNLKHAQAIGYKPIGIEPSRTNVEYIRRTHRIECLVDRLEDANIKPDSIDNVWMSHVFEHVEDPRRLALNVSDILRTNGRLFIWTPNVASYAEPLFRDYCGFYNTFDHVSFFSPKSISFLASVSGLQVEYIRTGEAHYDFAWNLIQYFKVKFTGRRCRLLRREASKGRIDVYTNKKVFSLVSAMANAFQRTSVVWGQPFKIFALAGRGSELHCILTKK